jgi:hypothetical protein
MTPNECFWSTSKRTGQRATEKSRTVSEYNTAHRLRQNTPSKYNVGDKVLVRAAALAIKKGGKLRSKRFQYKCFSGTVIAAKPNNYKYEIAAKVPGRGTICKWVTVNHLTSWTRQFERNRKKGKNLFSRCRIFNFCTGVTFFEFFN